MAAAVPARSKAAWALQAGGVIAAAAPNVGLISRTISSLNSSGVFVPSYAGTITLALGGTLGLFYAAKGQRLFKKKKKAGIWIGDMFIEENAFWTSILITGRPGAGKTSGAIMPPAEQLFELYTGEDYIEEVVDGVKVFKENPYARIGGTVLEVKGEFYEMIAYLMNKVRRNVYEDFLIIRPDSNIPVVHFRDPETGFSYYMNGLPCASGSEAGTLLRVAYGSTDRDKRIREDIFSCEDKEFKDALPALRALKYTPTGHEEYIGWRHEGGKLKRVSHTPAYNTVEYVKDANGNIVTISSPKALELVDRIFISNGLNYNLIDPSLGHTEAGEKLARMASVAGRGEKGGGDNSYWYNNAQKLISSCIQLRRAIRPDVQVTCADVNLLVANDKDLNGDLAELGKRITAHRAELSHALDPDKKSELEKRVIEPLTVLQKYFTGEWIGLDEKTKGIIKTVVTNTFSVFVQDPALKETFCTPATFGFSECGQKGRVFCFVPGPKYENLAKTIGTGLKLDFQRECLQRISRSDYNKKRPILHLTDECWNWIISGGSGGGDPKFLSLCRQARVINLLATQNYDQFVQEIGRDATNNYLGEFGVFVWLQNLNEFTNKIAEGLMETVKQEKFKSSSGPVSALNMMDSNAAAAKIDVSWEEKRLYRLEDFIKLSGDEAIVFNAYRTKHMAQKTELPKSRLTHPDEQPLIAKFMRGFMRGSVEQALHKVGRTSRVDHVNPSTKPTPTPVQTPATKPASATPPVPTPSPAPPSTQAKPTPSPEKSGHTPNPEPALPPPEARPAFKPASDPVTPSPEKAKIPEPQPKPVPPVSSNPPAPTPPPTPSPAVIPAPQPTPEASKPATGPVRRPYPKLDFKLIPPSTTTAPKPAAETGGAADNSTPKTVEVESEAFREMWGRLMVAAAEMVSSDDMQMNAWIQDIVKKKKAGDSVGPEICAGPNGFSMGDAKLRDAVNPLTTDSLDQLQQQQDASKTVQSRQQTENAFRKNPGPPKQTWWNEE